MPLLDLPQELRDVKLIGDRRGPFLGN
ncbi:MAG: hypothetical protein K0S07_642, partial [Chlamydiales bacterium]|nr:hypothetical protein [Chlamydiales bacterium]